MRLRTIGITASLLIAAGIALSAHAGDPPAGEPIKFTQIWQPGMTTYYRLIAERDSKTLPSGSADEIASRDRVAAMVRMEVYSVREDGTARVALSVTRIRRQGGGSSKPKEVFDTASPPEHPPIDAKMIALLVNRTVIVEITPEGRMLHIQGVSEIIDSVIKSFETEAPGGSKFLEALGFDKKFKELSENIGSQMIPSGSLGSNVARRVGEQWSNDHAPGPSFMGMQGESKETSTFESVDLVSGRRIARISTVGTKSAAAAKSTTTDPKLPFQMPAFESTGTTHGLQLFDLDRGRIVRWESYDSGSVKMQETKFGDHTMPGSDMQTKSIFLMELVGPEDSIDPQSESTKGK